MRRSSKMKLSEFSCPEYARRYMFWDYSFPKSSSDLLPPSILIPIDLTRFGGNLINFTCWRYMIS